MGTRSWVLSLRVTFFLSIGTTDVARQLDGLRVRTCVRKLFTSTWTRPSTCHFHSSCVQQWMLLRRYDNELTHVHRNALCIGQRHDLCRIITQDSSIQHAMVRSALERSISVTFFLSNGTADLARQPDGMRVRTCVRKLFTSTWTPSTCHSTRLAFYSGCSYVDAMIFLCPGEEILSCGRLRSSIFRLCRP